MEIEIIKKLPYHENNPCFEVKSNIELLTYILLNQGKILDGFKIVMVENSNKDGIEFDLQNPILLLQSEIKNLNDLLFKEKFNTLLKE